MHNRFWAAVALLSLSIAISLSWALAQSFWFLLPVLILRSTICLLLLGLNLMMSVWQKKIQRGLWKSSMVVRRRYISSSCYPLSYMHVHYFLVLYSWCSFSTSCNSCLIQTLGSTIRHSNLQNIQTHICLFIFVKVTKRRLSAMLTKRTLRSISGCVCFITLSI